MKRHLSELLTNQKQSKQFIFQHHICSTMTEIWLNYGPTDLVVDISAENLGDHITSRGEAINGSKLAEKLGAIDTSKGTELAVLHDTPAVRETIVLHVSKNQRICYDARYGF